MHFRSPCALRKRPVHIVPRTVLRGLAIAGDVVVLLGGKFPIFTSRYRSTTENYVTPMEKTFKVLGKPSISLQQGIQETVSLLRSEP